MLFGIFYILQTILVCSTCARLFERVASLLRLQAQGTNTNCTLHTTVSLRWYAWMKTGQIVWRVKKNILKLIKLQKNIDLYYKFLCMLISSS